MSLKYSSTTADYLLGKPERYGLFHTEDKCNPQRG